MQAFAGLVRMRTNQRRKLSLRVKFGGQYPPRRVGDLVQLAVGLVTEPDELPRFILDAVQRLVGAVRGRGRKGVIQAVGPVVDDPGRGGPASGLGRIRQRAVHRQAAS